MILLNRDDNRIVVHYFQAADWDVHAVEDAKPVAVLLVETCEALLINIRKGLMVEFGWLL